MKTNSINPLEGKKFTSLNQITEHPNTQRRPLQQTSASMPNKQKPTIKTDQRQPKQKPTIKADQSKVKQKPTVKTSQASSCDDCSSDCSACGINFANQQNQLLK